MSERSPAGPALTLVLGPEQLLADRAVMARIAQARHADPAVEVHELDAATVAPGEVTAQCGPSLFATSVLVVVRGVAEAADEVSSELSRLATEVVDLDGVALVLVHRGGNRGRRLLEAVRGAGAQEVSCAELKYDSDKVRFVESEFRQAHRRASPEAVRALVDAVGSDLRELASACAQLICDTTGVVGADVVERYHSGRVEATGFKVSDAALEGRAGEALALLRHALATGVDPVPINASLGAGLRALAKVAGAGRGSPEQVARELGMAPFQVRKARAQAAGWTPHGVARAIEVVAWADAQIKGAGADPRYALERAVVTVAAARSGA